MNIWFKIVSIAVLVLAIVSSYWYTYKAGERNEQKNAIVRMAESNAEATKTFDNLWDLYIAEKDRKDKDAKIIKQRVVEIVNRPVYQNVCLDDEGVDLANQALSGKVKQ